MVVVRRRMAIRRRFSKALVMAVIGAALVPALGMGVGAAEDLPIVLLGRVEWIAAEVMVIALDGMVLAAGAPAALNVDLSQIDQDEYRALVTGDAVLVSRSEREEPHHRHVDSAARVVIGPREERPSQGAKEGINP